jgi:hypothetical protein
MSGEGNAKVAGGASGDMVVQQQQGQEQVLVCRENGGDIGCRAVEELGPGSDGIGPAAGTKCPSEDLASLTLNIGADCSTASRGRNTSQQHKQRAKSRLHQSREQQSKQQEQQGLTNRCFTAEPCAAVGGCGDLQGTEGRAGLQPGSGVDKVEWMPAAVAAAAAEAVHGVGVAQASKPDFFFTSGAVVHVLFKARGDGVLNGGSMKLKWCESVGNGSFSRVEKMEVLQYQPPLAAPPSSVAQKALRSATAPAALSSPAAVAGFPVARGAVPQPPRYVALKAPLPWSSTVYAVSKEDYDLKHQQQLQKEADILHDCAGSPYSLGCYGWGVAQLPDGSESLCSVLELSAEGTLMDLYDKRKKQQASRSIAWAEYFTPAEVRDIMHDVTSGMALLHEKSSVMHGDLKPENIVLVLLDPRPEGRCFPWRCKIIDFGSAAKVEAPYFLGSVQAATPGYLSPEQRPGHRQTPVMDSWQLACLLMVVKTGHLPFTLDADPGYQQDWSVVDDEGSLYYYAFTDDEKDYIRALPGYRAQPQEKCS